MNQIELGRHPDGHVLYVYPWAFNAPWVKLKLMLHEQRLEGKQRVWLSWNYADQRFGSGGLREEFKERMPAVYDWALDLLEGLPDGWVGAMAVSHSELSERGRVHSRSRNVAKVPRARSTRG